MSEFWKVKNAPDAKTIMKALINPLIVKDNNLRLYIFKKCVELGWSKLIGFDLVQCRNKLIRTYNSNNLKNEL